MFELLNKGGWVMYWILGCSVLGFGIILERFIYFYWTGENYKKFLRRIRQFILQNNIKGFVEYARNKHSNLSRLSIVYLRNLKRNDEVFSDILHRVGSQEISALEQRLGLLSIIGHLSPLLGLFGTVLGMIGCFQKIEALGGQVDVHILAGGIWVALLTTVFGLIVAMPVIVAHHCFEIEATKRANQMQYLISELNQMFNLHQAARNIADDAILPEDANEYAAVSAQ
jgi:biopolymer transport protein ExbB